MAAADPSKQTPLKAVQVEALVCSFTYISTYILRL